MAEVSGGGQWRRSVAEREGFEPSIRYKRIHTFQACAFDHSAISPIFVPQDKLDCSVVQSIFVFLSGLRGIVKLALFKDDKP